MIILRDPRATAAIRLLETSVIVSLLAFLGTLANALQTGGLQNYDWHSALSSLILGVGAGLVNAVTTYLSALQQQLGALKDSPVSGTTVTVQQVPLAQPAQKEVSP